MKTRTIILSCALSAALAAVAVPARRAYFPYTQPDGTQISVMTVGDEFGHYYVSTDGRPMSADAEGWLRFIDSSVEKVADSIGEQAMTLRRQKALAAETHRKPLKAAGQPQDAPQYGLGLFSNDYPCKGEVKSLVFLVEYQDLSFTTPDAHTYYTRLLNEEGFSENGSTGSARDYFLEQSGGQFKPHFDVFGPVLLPNKMSYYGANDFMGNDRHAYEMITDAAAILADQIDFSEYDLDNDGNVDNIYVIYAGYGENNGGAPSSVWPHSHYISNGPVYNGKKLYGYACSNEIADGKPDGIGTFCHEYSHVLGLPDLYSTASNLSCTPNSWDLMDSGSYNNDSNTPPNYSSFERNAVGWMRPFIVSTPMNCSLEHIGKSNNAYLIPTSRTNEFYLLENRQKTGWDAYLPGHGMLIWHVDYNISVWTANTVNNIERHQYVDIVEASGTTGKAESVLARYTYPGPTQNTSFTAETEPAMIDWSGFAIDYPVTEIAEDADGVITFKIAGGVVELDIPAAPVLTADTEGILTITWQAVEDATSYDICVYNKDDGGNAVPLHGYTNFNTGNVLSYKIEGIHSETEYFARVRARNGNAASEYSDEGSAVAPVIEFTKTAPIATDCRFDGQTATLTWDALPGASGYFVTVEKECQTGDTVQKYGFGKSGDSSLTIPEGWSWNERLSDCYTAAAEGYYGEEAPSVKFPNNKSALETKVFESDIQNLSFWFRTASASFRNKFHIEGRSSFDAPYDTIMSLEKLNTYNGGGQTLSVESMPESIRQIRFSYERYGGFAILDDVALTFPGYAYEPFVERADAGNTVSYSIVLPAEAVGARFFVEAFDADGNISRRSNSLSARTGAQSAVSTVATESTAIAVAGNILTYTGAEGTCAQIYNADGTLAAVITAGGSIELHHGIYIARTSSAVRKIAIR